MHIAVAGAELALDLASNPKALAWLPANTDAIAKKPNRPGRYYRKRSILLSAVLFVFIIFSQTGLSNTFFDKPSNW
jgi:hypothetical protein